MQYRILGPLAVAKDDSEIVIGSGKQRALLALLLLNANEAVSTDRLIDQLWGESRSTSATKVLQNYVSKLRRLLGDGVLITRAHGYELRVEPGELDVDRFDDLVADGRRALAAGDPERAAAVLAEALALWRGPPLADFAYEPFASAEIERLERAAAGGADGADRRRSPARSPRRPDRRARDPRRALPAPGAAPWPAHARALPFRTPGRGAPGLQGDAAGARRRARDRAERGAAAARARDPRPRSVARAAAVSQPGAGAGTRRSRTRVGVAVALLLRRRRSRSRGSWSGPRKRCQAELSRGSIGAIDPRTDKLVGAVPVTNHPARIAAGIGQVWALSSGTNVGTMSEIDPRSLTVADTRAVSAVSGCSQLDRIRRRPGVGRHVQRHPGCDGAYGWRDTDRIRAQRLRGSLGCRSDRTLDLGGEPASACGVQDRPDHSSRRREGSHPRCSACGRWRR